MPQKLASIDYVCTWCGKHDLRSANMGRPAPGVCPRKPKSRDGQSKPHTWTVNRKFYIQYSERK